MRTIETKVYSFNELTEDAKEKAREWYREGEPHHDWHEPTIDNFKEQTHQNGFVITNVYFSGFWSQGDGAMFEYDGISDELLEKFVDTLGLSPMRKNWLMNNLYAHAQGRHSGHYYHSGCCSHQIEWEIDNAQIDYHQHENFYRWIESFADDFETYIEEFYGELCDELYRNLESDYEWLMSDECIDEILIINEYEFTEDGNIF